MESSSFVDTKFIEKRFAETVKNYMFIRLVKSKDGLAWVVVVVEKAPRISRLEGTS